MAKGNSLENQGTWYLTVFTERDASNEEKESVEAIPDFWILDDKKHAVWPPFKNERKIIKPSHPAKLLTSWLLYEVKQIYLDVACTSYEEAAKKAELAEDTSVFNDEDQKLQNPNNRKFYKRKKGSSSDEDEEEQRIRNKKFNIGENSIPTSPTSQKGDIYNLPAQILTETETDGISNGAFKDNYMKDEASDHLSDASILEDTQEPIIQGIDKIREDQDGAMFSFLSALEATANERGELQASKSTSTNGEDVSKIQHLEYDEVDGIFVLISTPSKNNIFMIQGHL